MSIRAHLVRRTDERGSHEPQAEETMMKFMVMHKADAHSESEPKPTQELIDNVGKLLQDAMANGTFVDGAGLRASRHRARVTAEGGVQQGPYTGANELVSEVAHFKVDSMSEALAWGAKFAKAAGASEVEVGRVTEPWDLGVVPPPEGHVPVQTLALAKATPQSEAGAVRPELAAFLDEARAAGVLVGAHSLFPSAQATRLQGPKGARQVVDGPFSESKELVGGFLILHFESQARAVEFARRYADVVGTPEVDVREVR
ncbi:MAG TPA: YciI family protein [Polyangiales bacterium]